MTVRRYLQLDVFANRPGAGNPLGVVFDAADLDSASMQAYAAWANLSETIFFVPPSATDADYHIRIFTPRQELSFAGHPSVGAAWAALEAGLAHTSADGKLLQECAAGLLPVRTEQRDAFRVMHVRTPRARPMPIGKEHQLLLDAALQDLTLGNLAPALWNNGPNFWLVELPDALAVRTLVPRLPAIASLCLASGAVGLAVFGRAQEHDHDLAVRVFCPADGIPEDPVTGAANASIAARMHAAGILPGSNGSYVASQGRELGRDGRVEVKVDADGEVWIGGQVQAVIRGSVDC